MTSLRLTSLLSLSAILALAPGCTGDPTEGPVGDVDPDPDPGADPGEVPDPGTADHVSIVQGRLAPGGQAALIAHAGAGSATEVLVLDLARGPATVVGHGAIASDGSFSVNVPPDAPRLIVTAVDAAGSTAAAGILDRSAAEGAVAPIADLGEESTLEAEAALDLVTCGLAMQDIDTVDLQARISRRVATAVSSAIAAGASAEAMIHALAQATGAAQATELASLASSGISVTRQDLFESGLAASLQLHRDLSAGVDSGIAFAAFTREFQGARSGVVGADPGARSQVASAIAFGSVVEELMNLPERVEEIDAVVDAVLISLVAPFGLAGVVEALDEIMDPVVDLALEQVEELLEGLGLESFEGSMGDAEEMVTGLLDGVIGNDGVLGLLGLGGLLGGDFADDALAMAEERAGELHAAVAVTTAAAAAAAIGAGQCIDFGALADSVVESSSELAADVREGVQDLAPDIGLDLPTDAELAAMSEVLSLVEGLLSVGL